MGPNQENIKLLKRGEITSAVLSPWGSNYTFLVQVRDDSGECRAVYKPRDGEIPLWDFPRGTLYKRECAAYLMSQILGWEFIPPTVIRDGPYGIGSVQLFVEHDPKINYHTLREAYPDALRMTACFDIVANNADRKPGHCIQDTVGKLWGIDHGLTFNIEMKVRTVIWDFGGEDIPDPLLRAISAFPKKLEKPQGNVRKLVDLLEDEEVQALVERINWLLEVRQYPALRRRRL